MTNALHNLKCKTNIYKMEHAFTNMYEAKIWGDNENAYYKGTSGLGSSIWFNKNTYDIFLKQFISDHAIRNIVDLGFGDFRCGKLLYDDLDVLYTGYDIYNKVIDYNSKHYLAPKYRFIYSDFFTNKENIQSGDLCILKDVLQYWPLHNIYSFLDFLVKSNKFKYILICNCCNQRRNDTDIKNLTGGDWRPLSSDFFPLKKYNPTKIYNYRTKEVSIITV